MDPIPEAIASRSGEEKVTTKPVKPVSIHKDANLSDNGHQGSIASASESIVIVEDTQRGVPIPICVSQQKGLLESSTNADKIEEREKLTLEKLIADLSELLGEQPTDKIVTKFKQEKENGSSRIFPKEESLKENLVDDLLDKHTTNKNKDILNHKKWFDIHPLLLEYEQCFFNWIPNDNPMTLEEAEIISRVLICKYEYVTTTGDLIDNLELFPVNPVEIISHHLIIAFCRLIQLKFVEATADLSKAAELIQYASEAKFISVDYFEGFAYLFTGLEALKKSLLLNYSLSKNEAADALKDLESFVDESTKFEELPKLAQVLIKGTKAIFVGNRRLELEELELMEEVIKEEQDSVEWLSTINGVRRRCRKDLDYRAGPSKEETQTLLRVIELGGGNHIRTKLDICMYLSEILRCKMWNPHYERITLGNLLEFTSVQEVVDFIKSEANEIYFKDCCGRINLGIAEIFGFKLPLEHRDAQLAKKCLDHALIYNPKSSKANHKMGLLVLTVEQKIDEAKKFIKEALASDPRNFPALIDLVHILLHKPRENAEELRTIFYEQIKPKLWSPKRLAGLLYNQGVHYYMLGRKDAAVVTWITMYQTDPESILCFKQLPYCSVRYLWIPRHISITNVYEHLAKIVSSKGSSMNPIPNIQEFDIIVKIFDVVKSAKSRDNRKNNQSQYREGMRGAGSYTNGNNFNNREQVSSYQDRRTSTFKDPYPVDGQGRSNTIRSTVSWRWRGNEEGSYQNTTDEYRYRGKGIDGNWRKNKTSENSGNYRNQPFGNKSEKENEKNIIINPLAASGRGFHSGKVRENSKRGRRKQ